MRSQAWKDPKFLLENSDVIPQLSVENHPSDRAFETLELHHSSVVNSLAKSTGNAILAEHLLTTFVGQRIVRHGFKKRNKRPLN